MGSGAQSKNFFGLRSEPLKKKIRSDKRKEVLGSGYLFFCFTFEAFGQWPVVFSADSCQAGSTKEKVCVNFTHDQEY